MTELDDRIDEFVVDGLCAAPGCPGHDRISQETGRAVQRLRIDAARCATSRQLTTKSRPLQGHRSRAGETKPKSADDSVPFVNKQRLDLVRDAMQTLRDDFVAFRAPLEALLADPSPTVARSWQRTDATIDGLVALLTRRVFRRAADRAGASPTISGAASMRSFSSMRRSRAAVGREAHRVRRRHRRIERGRRHGRGAVSASARRRTSYLHRRRQPASTTACDVPQRSNYSSAAGLHRKARPVRPGEGLDPHAVSCLSWPMSPRSCRSRSSTSSSSR